MSRNCLSVFTVLLLIVLLATVMAGCGDDGDDSEVTDKTGTLVFTVNAGNLARQGFVSEDGWHLDFTHAYINVQGITAFQVAEDATVTETTSKKLTLPNDNRLYHAGHPHAEIPEGQAHEVLMGEYFVDGHQGDGPIEIGRVEEVSIGNYNYLNFVVQKATVDSVGLDAEFEGYSIVLIGSAINNQTSESVAFTIKLTREMTFTSCGPHPENIGVVAEGGQGEAQVTILLDRIFGDFNEGTANPEDFEAVNYGAIGFGPFATLATEGVLDVTEKDLLAMPEYGAFVTAIDSLGHSGEADCLLEESEH